MRANTVILTLNTRTDRLHPNVHCPQPPDYTESHNIFHRSEIVTHIGVPISHPPAHPWNMDVWHNWRNKMFPAHYSCGQLIHRLDRVVVRNESPWLSESSWQWLPMIPI